MKFKLGDVLIHKTSGEKCVVAKFLQPDPHSPLGNGEYILSYGIKSERSFSREATEGIFELAE